jgi:hypothetical protein
MRSTMIVRRAAESAVSRLEARCRELAVSTARRCIHWVLAELAGSAAFYRVVDDVVGHLVRNPEVEELVRRSSVTLVGQALDELRSGASRADDAVDGVVHAIRRRLRKT